MTAPAPIMIPRFTNGKRRYAICGWRCVDHIALKQHGGADAHGGALHCGYYRDVEMMQGREEPKHRPLIGLRPRTFEIRKVISSTEALVGRGQYDGPRFYIQLDGAQNRSELVI